LCKASDGELEIGIFLPVAEEERELGEKTVVDIAHELDGAPVKYIETKTYKKVFEQAQRGRLE
jgi:hypothetical protein